MQAAREVLGGELLDAAQAHDWWESFRAAGRAAPADGVFHPLSDGVAAITRRLKQELDPAGLFNPGRLVPEL
ncbi:glycolate oxidase subunit [Bordetella pertussis]|nr:glycolate oxidase subunit [Bordetella pertussis]